MPGASWHKPSARVEGDQNRKNKLDPYPIGFFHIDLAEVRTDEGKTKGCFGRSVKKPPRQPVDVEQMHFPLLSRPLQLR